MHKFFAAIFGFSALCFGAVTFIGTLWIAFRYLIILWVYQSQSFWAFINPLIHIAIWLKLLSDPDIYTVILCGGLFYLMMLWTGKIAEKTKDK